MSGVSRSTQHQPMVLDAERVKYAPIGAADAAATLEHVAGQLRWLEDVSDDLARALTG